MLYSENQLVLSKDRAFCGNEIFRSTPAVGKLAGSHLFVPRTKEGLRYNRMPDFNGIIKGLAKTISENSPAILTAMAAAGVVTTTVMAVRATPKAMNTLAEEAAMRSTLAEEFLVQDFTPVEVVRLTWGYFLPVAGMAGATIGCIIGVNSVHTRRNAALASVYSLAESTLKEYQNKVVEQFGQKAEQKVRDSVNEDRVRNNPPSNEVIIATKGEMLCCDMLTGRYFMSDVESVRRAENNINARIISREYASQNDFYDELGLSHVPQGDDVGWRHGHMVDIYFSSILTDEASPRPCLAISHNNFPIANFYKAHF